MRFVLRYDVVNPLLTIITLKNVCVSRYLPIFHDGHINLKSPTDVTFRTSVMFIAITPRALGSTLPYRPRWSETIW